MGFLGRLVVLVLTALALALGAAPAMAGTVSVGIDGRGSVVSSDGAIDCSRTSDDAPEGTCAVDYCQLRCVPRTVSLQASAADGFAFRSWNSRACGSDIRQ